MPPSMWPQIRRRLEGDDEPAEPVEEEEADVLDPGDDAFEPDDFDDFDEAPQVCSELLLGSEVVDAALTSELAEPDGCLVRPVSRPGPRRRPGRRARL